MEKQKTSALNYSLHYLSYRPRSIAEVILALKKKKYTEEEIEKTIIFLQEKGFLNDESFAESWIHYRKNQSIRSRNFVRQELSTKGVSAAMIEDCLDTYYTTQQEKEILTALIEKQWQLFCSKKNGCIFSEELLENSDDWAEEDKGAIQEMTKIKEKLLRKFVGKGFSPYLVKEILSGMNTFYE